MPKIESIRVVIIYLRATDVLRMDVLNELHFVGSLVSQTGTNDALCM